MITVEDTQCSLYGGYIYEGIRGILKFQYSLHHFEFHDYRNFSVAIGAANVEELGEALKLGLSECGS